jgi:hypothetical protein
VETLTLICSIMAFVLASVGLSVVFIYRKPGLRAFDVLVGGPYMFFSPAQYVRPERLRTVVWCYLGALASFAGGFLSIWVPNNVR